MIFTAGLRFLFLPRGRKDLLPLARPRKNEKIGTGTADARPSAKGRRWKKRGTGRGEGVGDSVTYAFGEVDTGSANCYN